MLTQEDEDVLPHQSDSRKRSRAEPKKHLRKKTDQQDDEQDDEPAVKKPRSKAQIKKGICFTCQNRFYRAHLIPGHLDHLTESERELQEIREFEARLRERDERHTKKKVISSTLFPVSACYNFDIVGRPCPFQQSCRRRSSKTTCDTRPREGRYYARAALEIKNRVRIRLGIKLCRLLSVL